MQQHIRQQVCQNRIGFENYLITLKLSSAAGCKFTLSGADDMFNSEISLIRLGFTTRRTFW
ncbi:hypothetical protein AA696_13185 [Salmonella enterica subsp. enterica]|nr:hypothetical protein [Salmonella enterica subsp. enterica]EBY5129179.1 hypothetical protein [Salmonella enterica subsp. enterica serovar Brazzaville]EEJ7565910.1 hypothetical protein [Salmonella enterica subsp. salamae]EGZ4335153.1 hypothetical protein [Salmonella enterica subsp. enterica serovar Texas]ECE6342259.1 hypothetical protein [Salmonella enterica subsp. enterica]